MEVSFCIKNIKVLWTFLIHDFIRKTYPKLLPYIKISIIVKALRCAERNENGDPSAT